MKRPHQLIESKKDQLLALKGKLETSKPCKNPSCTEDNRCQVCKTKDTLSNRIDKIIEPQLDSYNITSEVI